MAQKNNNRKVLMVEDDTFLSGLLASKLEQMGFSVQAALTVSDARRILLESADISIRPGSA